MKQLCVFHYNIFDSFWVINHTKLKKKKKSLCCICLFMLSSWHMTVRLDVYELHTIISWVCKIYIKAKTEWFAQNMSIFYLLFFLMWKSYACHDDKNYETVTIVSETIISSLRYFLGCVLAYLSISFTGIIHHVPDSNYLPAIVQLLPQLVTSKPPKLKDICFRKVHEMKGSCRWLWCVAVIRGGQTNC